MPRHTTPRHGDFLLTPTRHNMTHIPLLHPFPQGRQTLTACAADIQAHVASHPEMTEGEAYGKMYGVLTVETSDGQRGYLAAHSGLLGGRNDWQFFVPPVFDAQQSDGYFKTNEREISGLNREIAALLSSTERTEALRQLEETKALADATLSQERQAAKQRKAHRDALRREQPQADDAMRQALIRESQHDKAQLRRMTKAAEAAIAAKQAVVTAIDDRIAALKRERHERSDSLQRWLFTQYRMLNARGEQRDLIEIFRHATATLPPAGSGDCCAPKLLQYAFAHAMRPLALTEFWLGTPPPGEVRRHMQFYPPCRSKCRPILQFMLQGLDAPLPGTEDVMQDGSDSVGNDTTSTVSLAAQLQIVYEDSHMVVVSKPSGMLSVPGKDRHESVESIVRQRYAIADDTPVIVHRLDMDTSGLLVVALTREAHKALQQQFLAHTVSKRYIALLEGVPQKDDSSPHVTWHSPTTGTITLPLRPDLNDRPRQLVDFVHGKPAQSRFCLLRVIDGRQLIALTPVTGRTHQLRMHCAHQLGLNCPIVGDRLYGSGAALTPDLPQRLCLHADMLTLRHPATGKIITFKSKKVKG